MSREAISSINKKKSLGKITAFLEFAQVNFFISKFTFNPLKISFSSRIWFMSKMIFFQVILSRNKKKNIELSIISKK